MRAVLLAAILIGCGAEEYDLSPFHVPDDIPLNKIYLETEKYFEREYDLEPGWIAETEVYTGNINDVSEFCETPEIGQFEVSSRGCNYNHIIVYGVMIDHSDYAQCYLIAHELAHSAAKFVFGTWDSEHTELPWYSDDTGQISLSVEICEEAT